jgi:hypothetical protein
MSEHCTLQRHVLVASKFATVPQLQLLIPCGRVPRIANFVFCCGMTFQSNDMEPAAS